MVDARAHRARHRIARASLARTHRVQIGARGVPARLFRRRLLRRSLRRGLRARHRLLRRRRRLLHRRGLLGRRRLHRESRRVATRSRGGGRSRGRDRSIDRSSASPRGRPTIAGDRGRDESSLVVCPRAPRDRRRRGVEGARDVRGWWWWWVVTRRVCVRRSDVFGNAMEGVCVCVWMYVIGSMGVNVCRVYVYVCVFVGDK